MRRRFIDDDFTRVRFDELPLIEAFKTHGREILGFVIVIAMGVSIILVFVYLATYLQQVDRISASRALGINTVRMMLLLVLTPLAGMVSDRVGRKSVLAAGFAGLVVLSWPLFLLLDHSQTVPILLGQCGFAALVAAFCGAMPAALVEMYPQRNRCSAMSFAYNASFGLRRRDRADGRSLSDGHHAQSNFTSRLSDRGRACLPGGRPHDGGSRRKAAAVKWEDQYRLSSSLTSKLPGCLT